MWYSSEFICVSPRHVSTPALSPGAVSLHLRHRLWHRHNPGYLESCIPLHTMRSTIFIDIRYPMHIPWTCRKLNLDHLLSLKHLEWDLDEKPRNRLTTPAVTWVWTLRTLTYLDIHRHHPARHHLTSPDITWGSPAAADNKKRAAKFHAPPATGLSWVENLLTVVDWNVDWIWTLWTGTLSTCRTCPPSPYFFFPILNFHRCKSITAWNPNLVIHQTFSGFERYWLHMLKMLKMLINIHVGCLLMRITPDYFQIRSIQVWIVVDLLFGELQLYQIRHLELGLLPNQPLLWSTMSQMRAVVTKQGAGEHSVLHYELTSNLTPTVRPLYTYQISNIKIKMKCRDNFNE